MKIIENLLKQSKIKDIIAYKKDKSIKIELLCTQYVDIELEKEVILYFKEKYNITKIYINISYSEFSLNSEIKEDIVERLIANTPLLEPFSKYIKIDKINNEYIIKIPIISKHIFELNNTDKYLAKYFKLIDNNHTLLKIEFYEEDNHTNLIKNLKKELKQQVEKNSIYVVKEQKQNKLQNTSNVIIKTPVMKIKDINSNYNKVAIEGKIINFNFKKISDKYELVTFDVTDYTSSITCKTFLNKKNTQQIRENVTMNNFVTIEGVYEFDTYEKANLINVKKIVKAIEITRTDNSEIKRVELHLHTKMSSMDGFIEPKKLFDTLGKWGHKYVAITDHGVLQAFPEVQKLAKKHNITPIYGVEGYLIDDGDTVVFNPTDNSLSKNCAILTLKETKAEITIYKQNIAIKNKSFEIEEIESIKQFIEEYPLILINSNTKFEKQLANIFIEVICLGTLYNKTIDKKLDIKKWDNEKHETIFLAYEKIVDLFLENEQNTTNKICKYLVKEEQYKSKNRYHVIILAKNLKGLKSLYELVSYSHLDFFYKKPIIPKSLLNGKRSGLIIGSACEAGELYRALVANKDIEFINNIANFYDYLEIQPVGNNEYLVRSEKLKDTNEIKNINKKVIDVGNQLNIPVIATCDAHFLESRDYIFREIIMFGQKYKDAKNQPPLYLRTTNEMFDEFDYLDEQTKYKIIVENSNLIANQVEKIKPIPDGTFPPKIEGSDEMLKNSTIKKAKEIYGEQLPEIVKERMNRELKSIISNGFSVMYIIAQKLVQKSLSDGYLVGSRGSVGSSFVAYLSGITEVNSLQAHYVCKKCFNTDFDVPADVDCGIDLKEKKCPKCGSIYEKVGFDIPFETFLGFYGDKEPDIDLNFSGDYQSIAHKYVEEIFGSENVFRAGTISTIASKTAYGFVKKYDDEFNENMTKAEINRLVSGCGGVKKTTGQHPGGIMVMPKGYSIHNFTSIQRPADAVDSGIITTHFDFHSLHGRLLKLDILGHDDPTMLKMLELITKVNPTTIKIEDEKIMSLFISNECLNISKKTTTDLGILGIPEFGTRFVRDMLKSTKPKTFSELVKISGLSHGTDVWENNAKQLVNNKTATLHEVICTRDDIMLYLIDMGIENKLAFDIMEKVRKGDGITESEEQLMLDKKIPKWYIGSCKKIKYMFPKAHAVAYVVMALRIAWFKIYYPLAYYTAYFSIRADEFDCTLMGKGINKCRENLKQLDNYSKLNAREKKLYTILEIVIEMNARGYEFLPVDIYMSNAKEFKIENEKLRMPFSTVPGLGEKAAKKIINERVNGKFLNIDEFRARTQVSKPVIEKMMEMGVFGDLPKSSQISFF